ncbi:flagellar hook-associated protein FlgK [Mesorhizobium sp. RP14(2022)]|uniref:Flagellar hook-associated protein 1 n=1 Tax=Mesorhizobium liriopis TaxID=2953882 RepID=A0ABT1C876_9HYPH|nr:flagellar hook-associated protein FlgK [Mesorhizobium liriopis]MCO6051041.1 flagellar hook-associated protein FlgK [Mesorhizobium liriopis]
MSLSTALTIAQSALGSTSRQVGTVSRNVANVNNADYNRRTAVQVTTVPGARVAQIQRAADEQLLRQNIAAISAYSGQSTLSAGLDRLTTSVNGVDNASAAATALSKLATALQTYSATPSNNNLAAVAVQSARDVVTALNEGSAAIQNTRQQADEEIASSVSQLNDLLKKFEQANNEVVSGTRLGRDTSDALDARDATLKQIAELVPVSAITRGSNDVVLVTNDGTTLFETTPREVKFTQTFGFGANTSGNAVTIDGVPVKGGSGASGKIAGLVELRDGATVKLQAQLDEVARGVIMAFRETDQTGGGSLDKAGLFSWSGGPDLPGASLQSGLAAAITVNAAFDVAQGGNPVLLRDGGANGTAYKANTTNSASYASLIIGYGDRLEAPIAFDPAAGLGASAGLNTFASASVGWLDGARQQATTGAETNEALVSRISEALSNATGVNQDTEMSLLLDLENSYQATARLIKAVDEMMQSLMAAV